MTAEVDAAAVGAVLGAIVGALSMLITGWKGTAEPRGLPPPNRAKFFLNCPFTTLTVRLREYAALAALILANAGARVDI